MKWVIRIVLIIDLVIFAVGFISQAMSLEKSDLIVGVGVLLFSFVLLPLFLYHRYRKRKLEDYLLNQKKMEEIIKNLKDNGL